MRRSVRSLIPVCQVSATLDGSASSEHTQCMPKENFGFFRIPTGYWEWNPEDRRRWCEGVAELVVLRADLVEFEEGSLEL